MRVAEPKQFLMPNPTKAIVGLSQPLERSVSEIPWLLQRVVSHLLDSIPLAFPSPSIHPGILSSIWPASDALSHLPRVESHGGEFVTYTCKAVLKYLPQLYI